MQAWSLDNPGPVDSRPLRLNEIAIPSPNAQQLRLRVSACGICRTDLHVVEGELKVHRSPLIPGHQIVGRVDAIGSDVQGFAIGDRVGVAWLHQTCGACEFCISDRENLCEQALFTGWSVDGGYAEFVTAPASFAYHLPDNFEDVQAAPLLCAGIIGFRCLRLTGITKDDWKGARLGIYGFGAAGHVAIQIARARGAEVYVCTRDRQKHQVLAQELGAAWVGDATSHPPVKLDTSIIFAPAGALVPVALQAVRRGGAVVLGGIHMSPIPSFDYSLIYGERMLRSVANNTRRDGREFLLEASSIPVRTRTQTFSFAEANDALISLKNDAISGAAVLLVD